MHEPSRENRDLITDAFGTASLVGEEPTFTLQEVCGLLDLARSRAQIGPGWLPTAANINALPEPLRRYIHDVETLQPTEMVQENHNLARQVRAVEAMVESLRVVASFPDVNGAWNHHTRGEPVPVPNDFVGKYRRAFEAGFALARWTLTPTTEDAR